MTHNILDYGAVGDGVSNDTGAIQRAIDGCAAQGGGRVLFPGGKVYRAGMLILRSHTELHLEMGAVLKGSDRQEDYAPAGTASPAAAKRDVPSYENSEYTGLPTRFFLYAKDCENVAVTGFGRIDGNEESFHGEKNPWHIEGAEYPRVPLLYLENVRHLTLHQVTLANSAFWTVHMVGCRDVLIDGIRILNSLNMANCDGIDPDHCQNVRIHGCHIETADDSIVFKNTAGAMQYGPCENIVVSDCTLISTSAAIKFGTESEDAFRNILVHNCTISRSNRGISLQLRDQGDIENVTFSNISIETRHFSPAHWWGAAEPIAVTALKRKPKTRIGRIRNVRFQNIRCRSENGILIHGEPSWQTNGTPSDEKKASLLPSQNPVAELPGQNESANIDGILFDGVSLELYHESRWPGGYFDLRPTFGPSSADAHSALYARHAANAVFRDCSVTAAPGFFGTVDRPFDVEACENVQTPDLRKA